MPAAAPTEPLTIQQKKNPTTSLWTHPPRDFTRKELSHRSSNRVRGTGGYKHDCCGTYTAVASNYSTSLHGLRHVLVGVCYDTPTWRPSSHLKVYAPPSIRRRDRLAKSRGRRHGVERMPPVTHNRRPKLERLQIGPVGRRVVESLPWPILRGRSRFGVGPVGARARRRRARVERLKPLPQV